MILTAVAAGLFQAGPAAAAVIPVIQELAAGPLNGQREWLAIAFAASICAGSSLFLWSATSGYFLRDKVVGSQLESEDGQQITFSNLLYFPYGLLHFSIQLGVAILWILIAI